MSENSELTARILKLERQLRQLEDCHQISDVYRRYMRGFDRNDVELLRSAFWPDAQINYSERVYTLDNLPDLGIQLHIEQCIAWGHLLTNETIEVDGDIAHAEHYVTGMFMPREDDPAPESKPFADSPVARGSKPTIISGRYVDRLDRRDGQWRIAVREFVLHFTTRGERSEDLFADRHRPHVWSRNDVSYRRPLKRRNEE